MLFVKTLMKSIEWKPYDFLLTQLNYISIKSTLAIKVRNHKTSRAYGKIQQELLNKHKNYKLFNFYTDEKRYN